MTILMATHEMGFARQVADRVCFLDTGVVLGKGPQQVLGDPVQPRTRGIRSRVIDAGAGCDVGALVRRRLAGCDP